MLRIFLRKRAKMFGKTKSNMIVEQLKRGWKRLDKSDFVVYSILTIVVLAFPIAVVGIFSAWLWYELYQKEKDEAIVAELMMMFGAEATKNGK